MENEMNIVKEMSIRKRFRSLIVPIVILLCFFVSGCGTTATNATLSASETNTTVTTQNTTQPTIQTTTQAAATDVATAIDNLPTYSDKAYIAVNSNQPFFTKADDTTESFEKYSELDSLGRCSVAYANVGKDIMPTEARGSIGSVKPSGWQTVKYDIVDGKYLYNRCHLIGFQLTGENANKSNLITGTRYLNIEGMLPFENMVADYVKETGNHVLYRVTPIFKGSNLVADGVLMEGYSVEDQGAGICFNVYAYNVQPGIIINYETGESQLKE
jgi:DNA-entry nuclease